MLKRETMTPADIKKMKTILKILFCIMKNFFCPFKIWFEPICFQVLWQFYYIIFSWRRRWDLFLTGTVPRLDSPVANAQSGFKSHTSCHSRHDSPPLRKSHCWRSGFSKTEEVGLEPTN